MEAGAAGPASAAPEAGGPAAAGRHLTLHGWTLLNEHGPGPNPGERLTAVPTVSPASAERQRRAPP
ncbi:hypothetical protein [Kitasatospora sp. NPDC094011]|uniref:hypothetical protein n=1 Tax=Kitasatospora sp. NPDC094011 TaxID=3364090 RepID=UPI0038053D6B